MNSVLDAIAAEVNNYCAQTGEPTAPAEDIIQLVEEIYELDEGKMAFIKANLPERLSPRPVEVITDQQ